MCRKLDMLPCYVEDRVLGLPLDSVDKVLRASWVTPVPDAPPAVAGVIDLRGRIVQVIDVRKKLGLPSRPVAPSDIFVVARTGGRTVVLWVDRTVAAAKAEVGEDTPTGDQQGPSPYATAIVPGEGELMLVLDLDRLLAGEVQLPPPGHGPQGDAPP